MDSSPQGEGIVNDKLDKLLEVVETLNSKIDDVSEKVNEIQSVEGAAVVSDKEDGSAEETVVDDKAEETVGDGAAEETVVDDKAEETVGDGVEEVAVNGMEKTDEDMVSPSALSTTDSPVEPADMVSPSADMVSPSADMVSPSADMVSPSADIVSPTDTDKTGGKTRRVKFFDMFGIGAMPKRVKTRRRRRTIKKNRRRARKGSRRR